MKTKHLFWGFLFITLGTLILINNFTSVNFYWLNIREFWPLFLILLGISLLIKQETLRAILISLTAIILGVAVFSTFRVGWNFFRNDFHFDFRNEKDTDYNFEEQVFEEEYNKNHKLAYLHFKGGAGSFKIQDTTSKLFSAVAKGNITDYEVERYDYGENVRLNFESKKESFSIKRKNRVDISLNTNPIWKMNFDIGAAASEFNLSNFKIEDLIINIGAASLKIILGDQLDSAMVEINAGASSVEIYIPENIGCEVNADVVLSRRKLDGFKKLKGSIYRTENFELSYKKIFINIDTGLSSVRIKRYSGEDW